MAVDPRIKTLLLHVAALVDGGKVSWDAKADAAFIKAPGVPEPIKIALFRKIEGSPLLLSASVPSSKLPWAFDPRRLRETVDSIEAAAEDALGLTAEPEFLEEGP